MLRDEFIVAGDSNAAWIFFFFFNVALAFLLSVDVLWQSPSQGVRTDTAFAPSRALNER